MTSVSAFPYGVMVAAPNDVPAVSLGNMSAVSSTISPVDAVATLQMSTASNGTQRVLANGTPTNTLVWGTGLTLSDYECRLVVNSGVNPTGNTLNTWLSCDTTRTWNVTDTTFGDGTVSSLCSLSIRSAATGTVFDTVSITFNATKEI